MEAVPASRDKKAPPTEAVFDGARLRALYWRGTADRMLVTFDHYDGQREGFLPFANAAMLDDPAAHLLRIQSARNDWYLNDELGPLMEVLGRMPRAGSVTMIGFSMGGYGAFLFSRVMGATRILAISPQAAIAPGRSPYETRWEAERGLLDPAADDLAAHVVADVRGHVLFDPHDRIDRTHAERLLALVPGMRAAPIPHGGHPATRLVSETRVWKRFRDCFDDPDPALALARLRRDLRGLSARWWSRIIAHAAAHGRRELILAALERMSGLPNVMPHQIFEAGEHLAELGDPQGLDIMEHAAMIVPDPSPRWTEAIARAIERFEGR